MDPKLGSDARIRCRDRCRDPKCWFEVGSANLTPASLLPSRESEGEQLFPEAFFFPPRGIRRRMDSFPGERILLRENRFCFERTNSITILFLSDSFLSDSFSSSLRCGVHTPGVHLRGFVPRVHPQGFAPGGSSPGVRPRGFFPGAKAKTKAKALSSALCPPSPPGTPAAAERRPSRVRDARENNKRENQREKVKHLPGMETAESFG